MGRIAVTVAIVFVGAIAVAPPAWSQTLPSPTAAPESPAPRAAAPRAFHLRFDHTNIYVRDLAASAAFYMDVLHLEELETPWGVNPNVRFFSLGGDEQLHMVRATSAMGEPDKVLHLAFTVADLDAYAEHLRTIGIVYGDFGGEPGESQVRPDGVRQIYFQDPDGNWIEVNDATY